MRVVQTVLVLWVGLLASAARAELRPGEVGIIALASSPDSRKVAEHYAQARKIPSSQILLLEGTPVTDLPRDAWESKVRPAIRAWLAADGRETRLRCLVTCGDVPLRIGRRDPAQPQVVARREFLDASRRRIVDQIQTTIRELDLIVPSKPAERPALSPNASQGDAAAALNSAAKQAEERVRAIEDPLKRRIAATMLERRVIVSGGLGWFVRSVPTPKEPEAAQRLEQFKGQLVGFQEGLQALQGVAESASRDGQTLVLVQRSGGLLGALAWVDAERESLQKNETGASFDNELCLILWPDYPLCRWQPNPLFYRAEAELRPKTIMVSRVAAPRVDLVLKLIDQAVAIEAEGLQGKIYLDARGLESNPKGNAPGSYSLFDESLRSLGARLKRCCKMPVVLDNKAELFQRGDCPDAALYCGWYSPGKYVDAFDWRPGAVGYHLGSWEAKTLTTPGNAAWCNAMLERGITATLGPVEEPYLLSFPLPDEFFSLLLTGRFPLAEVFFRTSPFTSWMMLLVGDPLYTPFRKTPMMREDDLPDRLRGPVARAVPGLPAAPETSPESAAP